MSLLSLKEVLEATGGFLVAGRAEDFAFQSVATDSRNVEKGALFIPLRGSVHDGHKFSAEAAHKGATVIFIDNEEKSKNLDQYKTLTLEYKTLCVVAVENTLSALQLIAEKYVSCFPDLVKIAVTGSSGKTTTKELLTAILRKKYKVVTNRGNLNSETGLPLSVFQITKSDQIGVFEMGMNRKNEIKELSKVLKANFALITNIGTAHIGILGSRDDIASEKKHVFDYVSASGAVFLNPMDDYAAMLKKGVVGAVIPYGNFVSEAESGVKYIKDCALSGTDFELDGTPIHLGLSGIYNYTNALAAIAVAKRFGVTTLQIKEALEAVRPMASRMETLAVTLKTGVRATLIKDCYNANPDSMRNVLEFCKSLNASSVIYVLGDMLELGDQARTAHEAVGAIVASDKVDFCVFIGHAMKAAYEKATSRGVRDALYIEESDEMGLLKAAAAVMERAKNDSVILLKGSRGLALERLVPLLSKEGVEGDGSNSSNSSNSSKDSEDDKAGDSGKNSSKIGNFDASDKASGKSSERGASAKDGKGSNKDSNGSDSCNIGAKDSGKGNKCDAGDKVSGKGNKCNAGDKVSGESGACDASVSGASEGGVK